MKGALLGAFDFSGEFVARLFDSQYSQAVKFVGVKMLYDHLYNISDVLTLTVGAGEAAELFYSYAAAEFAGSVLLPENGSNAPGLGFSRFAGE